MFYSWAAVARMREQKGLAAPAITATQLFALVSFSNCCEGGHAARGQPFAVTRLTCTLPGTHNYIYTNNFVTVT